MKPIAILITIILILSLSGCSLVREGITGDKPGDTSSSTDVAPVSAPAAYPIIGDWFGIYNDSEYVELRFTADGNCELQTAVYPSDMFGPRYYGQYVWGGDNGDEVSLDLYQGQSKQIDYGNGNVVDEWSDGGRDSATTALTMTFKIYGGTMKSFVVKAMGAGTDTTGYTVIKDNAFIVMLANSANGSGNPSPFLFGTIPLDPTPDKSQNSVIPDTMLDKAAVFFTTEELNVRCGPGTDSRTYGTIPGGTQVDQIGSLSGNDKWAFVLLSDGGGWVHKDYLTTTKPAPKTDTAANTNTAANAGAGE